MLNLAELNRRLPLPYPDHLHTWEASSESGGHLENTHTCTCAHTHTRARSVGMVRRGLKAVSLLSGGESASDWLFMEKEETPCNPALSPVLTLMIQPRPKCCISLRLVDNSQTHSQNKAETDAEYHCYHHGRHLNDLFTQFKFPLSSLSKSCLKNKLFVGVFVGIKYFEPVFYCTIGFTSPGCNSLGWIIWSMTYLKVITEAFKWINTASENKIIPTLLVTVYYIILL